MNIFITGGNGQVGFELQRQFALFGNILAPSRQELDLTDTQAVDAFLNTHKPSLILNAAAYTAVDGAESDAENAKCLNAELPSQLARYAAQQGVILVHYSSDYVYPGNGKDPWHEDSPTGPLSVYGQTKLAGDNAVVESGASYLIFRTSWVYAARGNNFMKTMLRLGKDREKLNIVHDQTGTPTPARLIAQVTALAVASRATCFVSNIPSGIYHLAPRGETSWHGFACDIFRRAKAHGASLAIMPEHIGSMPTADYPTPATRPLNSRLNLEKIETALGVVLPSWQQQLELTLSEYLEQQDRRA